MSVVSWEGRQFIMGVNYWPIRKAMYWWRYFDLSEVKQDFSRMAEYGLEVARIFLLWEDFQPATSRISPQALQQLVAVAEVAGSCGIRIMPTFFCGHMSGVNWMPAWMLDSRVEKQRFPVYSKQQLVTNCIRNFYSEPEIIKAQQLQCRQVAQALNGHPALFAYDLGNEASNCVIPPNRQAARCWVETMVGELKVNGGDCLVTLGMHAEDLEEDRNLWPQDTALSCDFLCMHGYPFYLQWLDDALDAEVLPFLGIVTEWLGGKPVLFQEFGVPGKPVILPNLPPEEARQAKHPLWSEDEIASFYRQALVLLKHEGMMGAMAWCYGDYHPDLWNRPPLKENLHERFFGLFRHDGSSKLAAREVSRFIQPPDPSEDNIRPQTIRPWLRDEDADSFYTDPQGNLRRLYRKYKEWLQNQ